MMQGIETSAGNTNANFCQFKTFQEVSSHSGTLGTFFYTSISHLTLQENSLNGAASNVPNQGHTSIMATDQAPGQK